MKKQSAATACICLHRGYDVVVEMALMLLQSRSLLRSTQAARAHSLWFLKSKNVKHAVGDSSVDVRVRCVTRTLHLTVRYQGADAQKLLLKSKLNSRGTIILNSMLSLIFKLFIFQVLIVSLRNTFQACLMLYWPIFQHPVWVLTKFFVFVLGFFFFVWGELQGSHLLYWL